MSEAINYPFHIGGRLPIGVEPNGGVVCVDPSTNVLVAGDLRSGCSSLMRAIVASALGEGVRVSTLDGVSPGIIRAGAPRNDFLRFRDEVLEYEDGTADPAAVMREIIAGSRPRPDLLVIDDADDLKRVDAATLLSLYERLNAQGVYVVVRVLQPRSTTRHAYGTRILMGHATPMLRQLTLGEPHGPRVSRAAPVGSGTIRYPDGAIHVFRSYWLPPEAAEDPEPAAAEAD